ncbi:hypothetical protein EIP86_001035 [Pleurotus ostreatoroseus]|nr:hypothetical protein EIP86_001035 [Pleurotus ostreatoroseus]
MDPGRYKTITTGRGLVYNYYASPAQPGKHTLLFLHGYPSTSGDWATFVAFFEARGHGAIVPDLLGFGGTDKPTDVQLYVSTGLVDDVRDILDAEKVDKVVVIGHDCNYTETVVQMTSQLGYTPFGYWLFFSGDADLAMKTHIDSFISVIYPLDPKTWITKFAPVGALQKALDDGFSTPLPSYITNEHVEKWKQTFLTNGFSAPNQWYAVMLSGFEAIDEYNKDIPPEHEFPAQNAPIFFAAAEEDYICTPGMAEAVWSLPEFKDHKITKKSYAADHWVIFSKAEQMCVDLEEWLGQVTAM